MHNRSEIYTKSLNSLKLEVSKPGNLFVLGGKTSTVLPYQKDNIFGEETRVLNLSQMPKELKLLENREIC